MKIAALLVALIHVAASSLTAGVPLCFAADGSSGYEVDGEACCGPDGCFELERHAEGEGPVLEAVPDCGGCSLSLAPLAHVSGPTVTIPYQPATPAFDAISGTLLAAPSVSSCVAAAPPPLTLPLRC